MALTADDIDRIARLARLSFAPDEAAQLQVQINGFFKLVDAMQAVDTQGVEPLAHPFATIQDVVLRLADDQVLEGHQRQVLMANAPAQENGVFLVPRVIE
jgi:aspartyl-tRNA(Asn)/glutamyl-tRNA(Gln) amidotransferase subunit C